MVEHPGIKFWAKTDGEGNPGISVLDHMIDVGSVAGLMAEVTPSLLGRLGLQAPQVAALASLHDVGKISPGFQRKCWPWLSAYGLDNVARNASWDTVMEPDHGKVSHAALQVFLRDMGADRKTAKFISTVLGGHHGRLTRPTDRDYRPQLSISEPASGIDWEAERMEAARKAWERFAARSDLPELSDDSPALWWLAGLTSVADWIGSDARFFSPEARTTDQDAISRAKSALETIRFFPGPIIKGLSFHELFHDSQRPGDRWTPNDMQTNAAATITSPGVYVIEAPMGIGKTEAALWAAYNLLERDQATGIYFALPTQATSNRIHVRMNEFLSRISPEAPEGRLIHGNSWLMAPDAGIHPVPTDGAASRPDDARAGLDWFASPKRALLAPFGVGTVDQALLGVVAAKHFFVRHFALAGKVVILDEVHSYDLYTGTLIDKLITTLEELGCTVIILSATLTGKRRAQIVSAGTGVEEEGDLAYPLISGRLEGHRLAPLPTAPPSNMDVEVQFTDLDSVTAEAIAIANQGGAVLWICDTVDTAQEHFARFEGLAAGSFPIGLLHSRFPFWRREQLENEWMARLDKDGRTRCGCILVSTQVVEQSVDLDADFMVTELAPTDMLLQRLGRLWRHARQGRPVTRPRLCILEEEATLEELKMMEAQAIIDALGRKAHVYAPFVLLRTLEVWKHRCAVPGSISIPSHIRRLIEDTYRDTEDLPASWKELFQKWYATDSARSMKATRNSNFWQLALEDKEGRQTRLNEMPTLPLVLCRAIDDGEVTFLDESRSPAVPRSYRFETAKAIHLNLVKVPKYCFAGFRSQDPFPDYIHEKHALGRIGEDGTVQVAGLKDSIRLSYSDRLGLVIDR